MCIRGESCLCIRGKFCLYFRGESCLYFRGKISFGAFDLPGLSGMLSEATQIQ